MPRHRGTYNPEREEIHEKDHDNIEKEMDDYYRWRINTKKGICIECGDYTNVMFVENVSKAEGICEVCELL